MNEERKTMITASDRSPPAGAPFFSIVYRNPGDAASEVRAEPTYFRDLALNQIVDPLVSACAEYDLAPYFYTTLADRDAIAWRHEVFRDLEDDRTLDAVRECSKRMRGVRERLAQSAKAHYRYEKERLHLGAARQYCDAIAALVPRLRAADLRSRGLCALRDYVAEYAEAGAFGALAADTARVEAGLDAVRYCILIDGGTVTVRPWSGEVDYTAAVEATFEKFRRAAVEDFRVAFPESTGMNHIEAQIQDRVALLLPESYHALDAFCTDHAAFVDGAIARFDREVQFYVAWLESLTPLASAGLAWCYPEVTRATREVRARDTYDLALATKLVAKGSKVVTNDFELRGAERIFVVSGPNNGGKTTFARTFGQLHHLAALGCPLPGTEARLYHCDRVFVHFERREDTANLRGKLMDDLVRIRAILDRMTTDSIVVMNEIFASTTLDDAVFLARKVLERIAALDAIAVCVTFLDELAAIGPKMVSMSSIVDPGDPAVRTYKVERRPPGGRAYALAIARKYRVDYDSLKRRLDR